MFRAQTLVVMRQNSRTARRAAGWHASCVKTAMPEKRACGTGQADRRGEPCQSGKGVSPGSMCRESMRSHPVAQRAVFLAPASVFCAPFPLNCCSLRRWFCMVEERASLPSGRMPPLPCPLDGCFRGDGWIRGGGQIRGRVNWSETVIPATERGF